MPDIEVEIPGVGVVAFPDSMSEQEINLAAQKLYKDATRPAPAPAQEPSQSIVDRLVSMLPTAGGIGGGIAGGIGGTAFGLGVGGAPGAIGGAALGGAFGESLEQIINRLRGQDVPATPMQAAVPIMKEGLTQGAIEGVGLGIAKGAGSLGRSFLENAVRPPETILREFPNVMETIAKERLPVGRGLVPGTLKGSQQAKGLLRTSSRNTRQLLQGASSTGQTFAPQQIAAKRISELADQIRTQPISGPDLRRLSDMTMAYIREHGAAMTPQAVKDMKQAAQSIAKPIFKAQQAGGGVSADQALGARFNAAIASGAKDALETIKGIAESEGRTQSLIGATRAITKAEARRLPLATESLSGAAAVISAIAAPGSGADDRVRNALVAWAVARGIGSPRTISRTGLMLTGKQAQLALREVPRLAQAAAAYLNADQTVEEPLTK